MKDLHTERTTKTPSIVATSDGKIEINGICVPEDSLAFFIDLKKWIEDYAKSPAPRTSVNVTLDYFNTSSARILLHLFRMFEEIHKNGNELEINWYHESDDLEIQEAGKDYVSVLSCPFNVIAKTV